MIYTFHIRASNGIGRISRTAGFSFFVMKKNAGSDGLKVLYRNAELEGLLYSHCWSFSSIRMVSFCYVSLNHEN
jgi:hypothetical protein